MSQKPEGDRPMMSGMANHAKATERSSAKVAAWSVLLTMGCTSAILQLWDATHDAHLFWLIAGLKGLAPVAAAMGLSEVGARYGGGKVYRAMCFAVMAGAMALSMSAIEAVVRPGSPAWAAWMFGVVLDAAALMCLHAILTERERRREAERAAAEHDAGAELAEAVAAAEDRVREELTAEAGRLQEAHAAETERLRTDLAAANATVAALREKGASGRKRRRTTGRKPAGTSARNLAPGTGPELTGTTAPEVTPVPDGSTGAGDEVDLDQEARLLILDYVAKGHSASEAGRLAGKTDGYGRQLVRLHKAAKKEPAGDERTEGDVQ